MKVLLINGSPNEHGCTDRALGEIARTLVSLRRKYFYIRGPTFAP